jgi:hypothetical protein
MSLPGGKSSQVEACGCRILPAVSPIMQDKKSRVNGLGSYFLRQILTTCLEIIRYFSNEILACYLPQQEWDIYVL